MMDATTLAALKGSIQHWRENVEAETAGDVRVGTPFCPLCDLYNTVTAWANGTSCEGCPVHTGTGLRSCGGSPYMSVVMALYRFENGGGDEAFRAAAQAELDFLISLLPEGETA